MGAKKSYMCGCGRNSIELTFHRSMPPEVVDLVFCPVCEQHGFTHEKSLPISGDWHVHFNLDVARMYAVAKLEIDPKLINPGFIIDGGYVE